MIRFFVFVKVFLSIFGLSESCLPVDPYYEMICIEQNKTLMLLGKENGNIALGEKICKIMSTQNS